MMEPGSNGDKPLGDAAAWLCLDCASLSCRAPFDHRRIQHPELLELCVAHVDCDAFYASVEKRDRPELSQRPVIVGGGTRGVVTTACYIARVTGVRSAMPMFKALRLCPDAVVIRPDFGKYTSTARAMRRMMDRLTPLVQPLSIDEAVLDLSGTAQVHGAPPAVVLARFALSVEAELGITISIGLARNRLLAKLAAERDKPRGFSVLGREARAWLAPQPVGILPGIGPAQTKRLGARGFRSVGDLQALDDMLARDRLGEDGPALVARARGDDPRPVHDQQGAKSVSAETTFASDLSRLADLERQLWHVCERLATRMKQQDLAAAGIVLKLKTSRFSCRTRSCRLPAPSRLPDLLFDAARGLLAREADGTAFRLIGVGANPLAPGTYADRGDLADPDKQRLVARQAAIDALRARFGDNAVARGRGLKLMGVNRGRRH